MERGPDDFVDVVSHLTRFVQNERIAAYNEAVDDMKESVCKWIVLQKVTPQGDDIPALLDNFLDRWPSVER